MRRVADRGIGGTGSPARLADRGIGGTGIVGVITGFASVCINGYEIDYTAGDAIEIDGEVRSVADLRIGQVAVIEASGIEAGGIDASGAPGAIVARRIAVRHDVSGPVDSASKDGTRLIVLGQPVATTPATAGSSTGTHMAKPGDWVSVSGRRNLDGTIAATRIDIRPRGTVQVSGNLTRSGAEWMIGGLVLRDAPPGLQPGERVTARGILHAGVLVRPTITQDPSLPFPNSVQHFSIAAFVRADGEKLQLAEDLTAPLAKGVTWSASAITLAVVDLQRGSFGLEVSAIREAGSPRGDDARAAPASNTTTATAAVPATAASPVTGTTSSAKGSAASTSASSAGRGATSNGRAGTPIK